jgi:hypothetical protein
MRAFGMTQSVDVFRGAKAPGFHKVKIPTKAKNGLEWGTRVMGPQQFRRTGVSAPQCPPTESFFEQVPGFEVVGVFGVFAVRGKQDVGLVVGGGDGEDIPGIGGDDEGGDEVDVVG